MPFVYLPILAMCFLSACVYIEKYPQSWAQIKPDPQPQACPSITGAYVNKGQTKNGNQVFLASLLRPDKEFSQYFNIAETVELTLANNDSLAVKIIGKDFYGLWSFERSKGQFKCSHGTLIIPQNGDMSGANVEMFGLGALDLYRVENQLIVNSHGGTAGIVLLIPVAGYGSDWARFQLK